MAELYLVSTPIGNMEDITLRALRILKEVDVIAAEDTRHTRKLLSRHDITGKTLLSYHDHNKGLVTSKLLKLLAEGNGVALVTDSGTPGISDPAFFLVREAVAAGVDIIPVPGPSAAVAALVSSGLPTDRFMFVGFLPKKKGKRKKLFEDLSKSDCTVVSYESPHRIASTIEMMAEVIPEHNVVIARELTKLHEEFLRGTAKELAEKLRTKKLRGEIVVLFRK